MSDISCWIKYKNCLWTTCTSSPSASWESLFLSFLPSPWEFGPSFELRSYLTQAYLLCLFLSFHSCPIFFLYSLFPLLHCFLLVPNIIIFPFSSVFIPPCLPFHPASLIQFISLFLHCFLVLFPPLPSRFSISILKQIYCFYTFYFLYIY